MDDSREDLIYRNKNIHNSKELMWFNRRIYESRITKNWYR